MSMKDAVGKAFGDDGKKSFQQTVAEVRAQHPSNRATARALGVDEKTVRRWLKGETVAPKGPNNERVRTSAREARVQARQLRPKDVVVKVKDRQDGRERTLNGEKLKVSQATVDRMGTAYARGDDAEAGRIFLAGVGDDFYHDWLNYDVDGSRFEGSDYGAIVQ